MLSIFDILGRDRVHWCAKKNGKLMGADVSRGESLDFIQDLNKDRWDMYVVLNPSDNFVGVKPCDSDITNHQWILLDIDVDHHAGGTFVGAVNFLNFALPLMCILDEAPLAATATYFTQITGKGLQLWLPIADTDATTGVLQARWVYSKLKFWYESAEHPGLKIDSSCTDASRLARWPMTTNWKPKATSSCILNLVTRPSPVKGIPLAPPPEQYAFPASNSLTNLSELAPRLTHTAVEFTLWGTSEERHKKAHATACSFRDAGAPKEVAEHYVLRGASKCRPQLSPTEAQHCVNTAYR